MPRIRLEEQSMGLAAGLPRRATAKVTQTAETYG